MKNYKYYDLIMSLFVTVLLVSNIASSAKIVDWGVSVLGLRLSFDAGTLLFPISYIFGDVLTEVYGYRRSRRVIWVGFGAAAILTVLGFLVFAIVSFKRRFIELGMLRAIGLSVGQMAVYLAGEQAALILSGMGLGTGLGVWASLLFIPFFQVGSDKTALVPPFVVKIAWAQIGAIYAIFGAMFVIVVAILIVLLIRMRVFEAVKLGETV